MNSKHPETIRGFSMVELMFAIAVVATSLLLFIGIFFTMFRATEKGVDLTTGTVVAESQLSKYLYDTQESAGGLDSLGTTGVAEAQPVVTVNKTEYRSEIRSWAVDPSISDLRKVQITTWWWNNSSTAGTSAEKTGYGKLNVVISRLIYTKSKIVTKP